MENVSFKFGRSFRILENFSLEVKKGELLYLEGQNASGKSTVLKILLGIIKPDQGIVKILDKNPYYNPEVLKKVGAVVDGMGFYVDLSLKENVLLFAKEKGINDESVKMLENYIKMWNIDFETIYKKSSHGMRKIAQLTFSIMGDPEILIWDEPELALDEKRQEVLLNLVKDYKSRQKTLVIAGTNPNFYGNLIDKTVHKEVIL
jgi:ABC-2 type transport system ATP-binding protein